MNARVLWNRIRMAATFVFLLGMWFLFSGTFSTVSFVAGVIFSAFLAAVTYDTFIDDHEAARNMVFPKIIPALVFFFALIKEMYAASYKTMIAVLKGPVSPRLVHFKTKLKSDVARVVTAQSITFTPGTITVELSDDHLLVHWLTATTRHSGRAGDEIKGSLEAAVKKVWL